MKLITKYLMFFLSFVFFIVSFPISSSLNISLDSPDEAELDSPFSVSVQADTSDVYDVKVYVKNSSDSILSEIKDDKWKSGIYYVNDAYPLESKFNIKVTNFAESAFICIKLRLSEKRKTKPPTSELCSTIKLINKTLQSSQEKNNTDNSSEQQTQDKKSSPGKNLSANHSAQSLSNFSQNNRSSNRIKSDNSSAKNKNISETNNSLQPVQEISNQEEGGIVILTTKASKNPIEERYLSLTQKTRLMALYSFTFVSIMVIILLLMRKI